VKLAYVCADFGVPVFGHKGASVHVREMVTAFAECGHDVRVFAPTLDEGPSAGAQGERFRSQLDHEPGGIEILEVTPDPRHVALQDELKSTVLFRPGFWLILAGMVVIAAMPARTRPAGAFAIAVAGSATIYVLTFLPFGVAADFRYGYWCVPACLVAAVALFAAYRERAPDVSSG